MIPKTPIPVAAMLAAILTSFVAVTPARAQTKAALVRDVDHLQPVNGYCYAHTNPSLGPAKCTLFSVPAGKRLVVETVSYSGGFKSGHSPSQIVFGLNNPYLPILYFPASSAGGGPTYSNTYVIAPVLTTEDAFSRTFSGTQALRIHIDENQSFAASAVEADSSNNGALQYFAFSGYLIDK